MPELKYKQDDRHDWLGDVAESFVAYCFAREKFEVFGAGKWAADVVAHDLQTNQWWRIEVKSGRYSSYKKLAEKADLFAKVTIRDNKIKFSLIKLWPEDVRGQSREIIREGNIRKLLGV